MFGYSIELSRQEHDKTQTVILISIVRLRTRRHKQGQTASGVKGPGVKSLVSGVELLINATLPIPTWSQQQPSVTVTTASRFLG